MTQTSKEYAEALFELALQDGNAEEVASALELLEKTLAENPSYQALLRSPAIPREERMNSLDKAFGEHVPLTVLTLLRMMVARGHAAQLDDMIRAWRDLAREHRGESVAEVTSAVALTEEEKTALKQKLEKLFSRHMVLNCAVDPSLIGGIRVVTEGRVIDGSLQNKLQQIKEVMDS